MAIILGCAIFQWAEPPRKAPAAPPKRYVAVKLDAKLLDACVGEYEFPPDNISWSLGLEWKLTIRRQGDQLMGQNTSKNKSYAAYEIYPESETNFFFKTNSPQELSFIKNDSGEVMALILHYPGTPDREGKKLKNE